MWDDSDWQLPKCGLRRWPPLMSCQVEVGIALLKGKTRRDQLPGAYMKRFGKKLLFSEMADASSCIVLFLTRDENPRGWCPSQPAPFCTHVLQQDCRCLVGKRGLLNFMELYVFLCLVPNSGLGYWLRIVFCAEWPFVFILKSFLAGRNLEKWSKFDTVSSFLTAHQPTP